MQGQTSAGGGTGQAPSGKSGIGTTLAAVALAIAVVALAVSFVLPKMAGPTGPAGTTGPQGPPAGVLWADVNTSGTLVHGSGSSGAYLVEAGGYQVNFTRDVTACSYVASLVVQNDIDVGPAGMVTVAGRVGLPDSVFVATTDTAGAPSDLAFDLLVSCQSPTWAVVSASGSIVRSADAVTSAQNSTGEYNVVFDQSVLNCAILATPGTTGSVGTVAPGYATVQGAFGVPDGVYVAIYNATGVLTNSSFHVVVDCQSPNWAVVTNAGVLSRGSAVSASGSDGDYEVVFNQDVMNCAYIGSAGSTGDFGVYGPAQVAFAGLEDNAFGIFVSTHDTTGAVTAESFHVGVFC